MGNIDDYANFQAEAKLNAEQYAELVATMTEWCEENQRDPAAQERIRVLKSIEFKRMR